MSVFYTAPLASMPKRLGMRVSPWEPVARKLLNCRPDRAVVLATASLTESRRTGRRVTKLLRDRGVGSRFRAFPAEVWLWRDETMQPKARVSRRIAP